MSENPEKKVVSQEQKENNSFSFIVGVFIALAIVILLAVFFNKYASLVAALQTLGYAIAGFEAAAVVTMEGKPIAQVSIDDQDLYRFGRAWDFTFQ
jgi:uncharacterized membrane protein YkgB